MKRAKALVITGNGTNCEREMAHGCEQAGAETRIVHTSEIFSGEVSLDDYHFLNLPGGFMDGDDLGSARAGAVRFRHGNVSNGDGKKRFVDSLKKFVEDGKLILGICNGFQLMIKMGLLPGLAGSLSFEQTMSLTYNDSGRFEDRWVELGVDPDSPCVFTRGIKSAYYPVRHGEGKLVAGDAQNLATLDAAHLSVLKYVDGDGNPTMEYPQNPNGSDGCIAGLCDPTGRLFGLMPHPEAFLHRTNHPRWTREELPEEGEGLKIFKNAVSFIEGNLL